MLQIAIEGTAATAAAAFAALCLGTVHLVFGFTLVQVSKTAAAIALGQWRVTSIACRRRVHQTTIAIARRVTVKMTGRLWLLPRERNWVQTVLMRRCALCN